MSGVDVISSVLGLAVLLGAMPAAACAIWHDKPDVLNAGGADDLFIGEVLSYRRSGSTRGRLMIDVDVHLPRSPEDQGKRTGPIAIEWHATGCGGGAPSVERGDTVLLATTRIRARDGRMRYKLMQSCCEPPMIVEDDPDLRRQIVDIFQGRTR